MNDSTQQIERDVCTCLASIQAKLLSLRLKYSSAVAEDRLATGIEFKVLGEVRSMSIQFDLMDPTKGAKYWFIEIESAQTEWRVNGYLYTNRDEMVFSIDEMVLPSLSGGRDLICGAIEMLDQRFSRLVN